MIGDSVIQFAAIALVALLLVVTSTAAYARIVVEVAVAALTLP
jgi:hypothetical protein